MFTTPVGYKMIASDLPKALERVAAKPDVRRETSHYLSKIGDIKTIDQFLKDDRVYQFAMRAFGLDEMIYGKAFMRKVLTEGIDRQDSFANRLADRRYRDFVEVFNFARHGQVTTTFTRAQQGTVDKYIRQTLEVEAGQSNEGVRLALYFQRKAPTVSSAYSLLADRALLKVTQVALGIPEGSGSLDIDRQAELIKKKLDVADLKEPAKLDKLLQRFTALWELSNPTSPAAQPANALLGQSGGLLDSDLLSRIQNLRLGR